MNIARYKNNIDSLLYLFGAAFSQGAFIIIAPLVIAHLGQEMFAELEILAIIVQLAVIFFGININSGLPRLLIGLNEWHRKQYLNVVVTYLIIISIVLTIFLVFSTQFISNYLSTKYIIFVPFLFLTNMLYYTWNDWCSVNKMSFKLTLTQILGGILKVSIVYFLIKINVFDFREKLYSDILAISIGSFFLFNGFRFILDRGILKNLLAYSAPIAIYSLSVFILRYYDQFLISNYFGKVELSYYTMAIKFSLLLLIAYKALSNHFNVDYFENRNKQLNTVNQTLYLVSVMFLMSIALRAVYWYYIKVFVTNFELEKAYALLKVNVVSVFIFCLFLIFAREDLFLKRTTRLVIPVFAGLLVSVVINTIFLQANDIYFAINTALYSSIVVLVVQIILHLKYHIQHFFELIISILCVLLLYFY